MSSILASLDMSLDDIIAKKKTPNPDARPAKSNAGGRGAARGGAGPVRNNRRGSRRSEPYARGGARDDDAMDLDDDEPVAGNKNAGGKHRAVVVKAQQGKGGKKGPSILARLGQAPSTGTKILVKNLKYDILEDDVRELFGTVGKVAKAEIVYDRSGRSKGIARVWFAKRADAEKTIKQFDGRTLDGQPMQITLDEDKGNVRKGLFGTALGKDEDVKFKVNLSDRKDSGSRGGRRGRGGRGGSRGGNDGGAPKSAADLDNEMDSYMKDA